MKLVRGDRHRRGRRADDGWAEAEGVLAHRVLIRTQPLGRNYGGILQAYALQLVIMRLGFEVATDDSQAPTAKGVIGRPILDMKRRLVPSPWTMREVFLRTDASLIEFAARNMRLVKAFGASPRPRRSVVSQFDTFVAGSDQVWRPRYSHVPSLLFDFLPDCAELKVISYAASFGTDDLTEYKRGLRRTTRRLAARFDSISVREESGIRSVRELWRRADAEWHVDPTLLLDREDYEKLLGGGSDSRIVPKPGGIVDYVLDSTPALRDAMSEFCAARGVAAYSLMRPTPRTVSEYMMNPGRYDKVSVESWLQTIRDCELLITDSFHGCVFAAIFHTPFVLIPNERRGVSRFSTLLAVLGLEQRSIAHSRGLLDVLQHPSASDIARVASAPISWVAADKRIRLERARAMRYLASGLGGAGVHSQAI